MSDSAITPQQVTEMTKVQPDEIAKFSEEIIETTRVMNNANDELDHLSVCLADLAQTHDVYQKKSKHVKNQMRYLSSKM